MSFASVAGIGAAVGGLGSLASAGMSIAGGLGGKSTAGGVQLPPSWQMPNMTGAANNAYGDIGNLPATNYGQQFLPQYEQATQNLYNNPYAGMAQAGSMVGAGLGQNAALNSYGAGQGLQGQAAGLGGAAGQVLNTAFDPQSALYARTVQQLQDQTRASEAARGVSTSPYGAGVENKAMSDFNIDWAGQQLGRQTQGLGAAGTALGQGASLVGQGQNMMNTAGPQYNASSAMPYNTAQGIGQGQQQAISSLFSGGAQAQGLAQTPIQDYLSYIQAGNQAGGVANQTAGLGLQQAQLGFNQNQTLGSNIGAGLAGLGNQNNWNWLKPASGGTTNYSGVTPQTNAFWASGNQGPMPG